MARMINSLYTLFLLKDTRKNTLWLESRDFDLRKGRLFRSLRFIVRIRTLKPFKPLNPTTTGLLPFGNMTYNC